MPNIIEQQDLLKGLPDNRLMTLLQNPVADIPPFLVAAEAQRRQAIRQQFAGSENKESVVDTLTKQLARVPQNISAPPQKPMQIPQTPQMQGVAALQQQQAIQQAAQSQQMRGGGMVQRYDVGGVVSPFRGRQGAGGYFLGEEPSGFGAIQKVYDYVTPDISNFLERMRKYGATPSQAQREEMAIEEKTTKPRIFPTIPSISSAGTTFKPMTPDPGKKGTSPENKSEDPAAPTPQPGETEDQFRARLEALYGDQELSDWEKSQKWFAMAEQFLDPSKTTMQSITGAGRAFAESAGEQERARRLMDLEREKALYEYDVTKAAAEQKKIEDDARARQAAQENTLKAKTDVATGQISGLYRASDQISDDLRRTIDAAKQQGLDDTQIAALPEVKQKSEILRGIQERIANLQEFLDETYGMPQMPVVDITNKVIR